MGCDIISNHNNISRSFLKGLKIGIENIFQLNIKLLFIENKLLLEIWYLRKNEVSLILSIN